MTVHPPPSATYRQNPQTTTTTRHRTPVAPSPSSVRCPSVTRSRLLALLIVSMTTTLLLLVHCLRSCDLITRRHQPCCHGNVDYLDAAGRSSVAVVNNSRSVKISRETEVSRDIVVLSLESAARRDNSLARVGDLSRGVARKAGQVSREIKVSRDNFESQKLRPGQDEFLLENQVSRKDSVPQEIHISLGNRKGIIGENLNQISIENLTLNSQANQNENSRAKQSEILRVNQNEISRKNENGILGANHHAREISNQTSITSHIEISRETRISQRNEVSRELQFSSDDEEESRGRLRRRLPQCLIIGVRKGGTRALLEFLNLHPSILAGKQEMHFFDDDQKYALGLDWYRKRMRYSLPEQITVEKTPAYFVDERVPRRVHGMNRTIRLLLTVRDPIDRAISDYLQIHSSRLNRGKFHPRFEDLAVDAATGEVNRSYKAIRRSIYHRHFERWLRYFRLEQFHFVSGENLVRDPVGELRKVERFLGIENLLDEGRFYYNKTRGFYCMLSSDGSERCLAPSKGRIHPTIDPDVVDKLRRFFRPHNQLFYEMVGVDFGWK